VTFPAKFHGRCGACDEHIVPGQPVKYVDDVLVHDDCEASAPAEVKVGETCQGCFTQKALDGSCLCD
jgi:hypothetical protein